LTKSIIVLRETISPLASFFGQAALLKLIAITDPRFPVDLAGSSVGLLDNSGCEDWFAWS